ncbi:MAG: hypothetical protein NTZ83_04525, partial [Candidatus Pacearchaeota archaeon]|nr:hypothetical protein [Candidatus Pacearchaeota archaeon]
NGVQNEIVLQPYILPTKEEFSSQDAFKSLSGPLNWNQQQGFYIYRSNRMIQSGGWCGLRTSDEHTKLIRIELNFSSKLDSLFKINVAKMRVQLPSSVREYIEKTISPLVLVARERYDHAKRVSLSLPQSSYQTSSKDRPILNVIKRDDPLAQSIPHLFTLDEIEHKAKELSTKYESKVISDVFSRLRKKLFGDKK